MTSSPLAIIDEHSSFACAPARRSASPPSIWRGLSSKVVGIIGVGNIGRTALLGLSELFPISEVRVTSQRAETRAAFAQEQSAALGLAVRAVDGYEQVCRGADIIISATPSTVPFIKYEWLKDGVFVGVLGHEEATHEVYAKCGRLLVDYNPATEKHAPHIQRAIDAGAITADKLIRQIWEVVAGKVPARRDAREKIVVATVGLTTQDTAIAHALYLQAKKEGRGIAAAFLGTEPRAEVYGMYGWRGRIGLMLPYDNAVIEPEFARTLPLGVSAHVVRTTKTDRLELAEESLVLAPTMLQLRANVALYACNASSFIQGRAWHDAFLARFQAAAGVPAESANSALMKLAAHRKVRRLAVVTPYPQWLLDPLASL